MSTFSALKKQKRKLIAPRIVKAQPDWFEEHWPHRPSTEVAIGLRLLSVQEGADARLEAEREVTGVYDGHPEGTTPIGDVLIEQYNEVLLCEALARALCNPNNVLEPYFQMATVTIRQALTSEALRRLWDEYLILSVEKGIMKTGATDPELALLSRALRSEGVRQRLTPTDRKLLAHVLANVKDAIPERTDDDFEAELEAIEGDDEGEAGASGFLSGEESIYIARSE